MKCEGCNVDDLLIGPENSYIEPGNKAPELEHSITNGFRIYTNGQYECHMPCISLDHCIYRPSQSCEKSL